MKFQKTSTFGAKNDGFDQKLELKLHLFRDFSTKMLTVLFFRAKLSSLAEKLCENKIFSKTILENSYRKEDTFESENECFSEKRFENSICAIKTFYFFNALRLRNVHCILH